MKDDYLLLIIAALASFWIGQLLIARAELHRTNQELLSELSEIRVMAEWKEGEILSHEIRQSGIIGLNLNGNPEI